MPSAPPITCDSSVLIPALLQWHPRHEPAQAALRRTVAIPAHVHAETFSVMTRLPDSRRPTPAIAERVLTRLGRPLLELPAAAYTDVVVRLAAAGIGGGAVYDAIVAATAREHDHLLLTADTRARATYDSLGVRYEFVDPAGVGA